MNTAKSNTEARAVAASVSERRLDRSLTLAGAEVPAPSSDGERPKSRLWLWFLAAFLLQAAAWTTWLVIASAHKVQEVPLASTPPSN